MMHNGPHRTRGRGQLISALLHTLAPQLGSTSLDHDMDPGGSRLKRQSPKGNPTRRPKLGHPCPCRGREEDAIRFVSEFRVSKPAVCPTCTLIIGTILECRPDLNMSSKSKLCYQPFTGHLIHR